MAWCWWNRSKGISAVLALGIGASSWVRTGMMGLGVLFFTSFLREAYRKKVQGLRVLGTELVEINDFEAKKI